MNGAVCHQKYYFNKEEEKYMPIYPRISLCYKAPYNPLWHERREVVLLHIGHGRKEGLFLWCVEKSFINLEK